MPWQENYTGYTKRLQTKNDIRMRGRTLFRLIDKGKWVFASFAALYRVICKINYILQMGGNFKVYELAGLRQKLRDECDSS